MRKKREMVDKVELKKLTQQESEQLLLKEANQVQTNALQSAEVSDDKR
jgi:hypothetical protein